MKDPAAEEPLESFRQLNAELARTALEVELCLVGGAVMVIVFNARPDTRRARALFMPTTQLRKAAEQVAERQGLPPDWINGSVRRLLGEAGVAALPGPYLDMTNLRVYGARPEYVLAMKVAAFAHDGAAGGESDIRYLLRFLDISTVEVAQKTVARYFTDRQLPEGTDRRLQALLP